jgi:NADPH2 dehydrogenase
VAKFFKYKSAAEIAAENPRLGIQLAFQEDLAPLFSPLVIAGRPVGNRFCIHPMEGCDGKRDGEPDELTYRRYRRFGAGGAKVIWGEAAAVCETARANTRQIWICERTLPAFTRLVQECRAEHRAYCGDDGDLLFGLQLTHSGRYCYDRPRIVTHDPLLDPKTIVDKATGRTVDASYPVLTDDELKALVPQYVEAAKLAAKAGFDFVDVKQCHRYLLNELLGARNRPGPFGGSYENRTRLAREIITAIRTELPGLIITTRINAFDGIPFSRGAADEAIPAAWQAPVANGWGVNIHDPLQPDLTEVKRWFTDMKQLGVSLINVTLGNPYAQPHFGRPFEYPPPDGYESPEHPLVGVDRHFRITAELQNSDPTLPLVGTGYSYLQEFVAQAGAANIAAGRVSFMGLGRASLSQPDFALQLQHNGKLDRKRVCRTFSYCTAMMRAKNNELGQFAAGCPPFDKEAYAGLWDTIQQLSVRK